MQYITVQKLLMETAKIHKLKKAMRELISNVHSTFLLQMTISLVDFIIIPLDFKMYVV